MKCCLVLIFFEVFGGCLAGLRYRNLNGCPPLTLKNGHVRMRQRARFARFSCASGYLLAGEKYSACIRGQWELPLPVCVRPSCSPMRTPANVYVHLSHRGGVAHFSCKPEHQLRGANISYCDGRKWDANPPVCQSGVITRPAYFCDFESQDICGWEHDVNHDFDWRRFNRNTPSGHVGTGPSFDHTKGEGRDGYYMYIESSSRFENDTARLISPFYDRTENNTCFEFYYHMHGMTMGTLRVYLHKANDTWEFDPKNAFFEKRGNQGDRWYRSLTSLGAIDEDFQIVIEGVRGPSYVSDIAVDDVRVIENCALESEVETTTTNESESTEILPLIASCEDRCGNVTVTTAGDASQISCDCDTECVDRNSCCPDYIAFCVLAGTDALTVTETDTATMTSAAYSPTTAREIVPPTARTVETHTLRSPIIMHPPTTEAVIEKKIAKTPTVQSTTEPTTTSTAVPTTATKTKTTSTTIAPATTYKIIILKPRKEYAVVVSATTIAADYGEVPTKQEKEMASENDDQFEHHLSPSVVSTVKEQRVKEHRSGMTILGVVAGVAGCLVIVLLAGIVAIRRYRAGYCARRMNAAGDSQSDVRFLTSDEVLDFRLAHADDDDF